MRTNKGPYSPQPMRQFGNFRTDRLQKPGMGSPMGGPKPMGQGQNLFGRVPNPAPTLWEQWQQGGQQPFGIGGIGGSQPSLGRSQQAMGQLQGQFNGGGLQGSPSVTGPQGGIPGLPGYDPNANVQGIGGNNAPQMGPALGPGDMAPNQYEGMSGSEIFARLFGQRP